MSSELTAPFLYNYMINAMFVSSLVGALCGFLSAYLILKGWSLIGDALSHSIVPGVAGAYMIGVPLFVGAFLSGGLAALTMLFVQNRTFLKEDVIIGLIFKTFFEKIVVLLNKFFDTSSFLLFLSIILSAAYIEKDILVTGFKDIGILVFIIFFSIFLICQSFLNQFKLNKLDKRCILTENVIQNNALSIIVGGMMLAKYQGLLVFPAVYAIFQYKVFIIYILYRTFKYKQ